MGSQGSSLHRGEKEVSPEKLQQLRKVLRKNFPPRVHGLEDVPGAVPAPRCRQGSPVAVPASPAHTAQLLLFPVDLFFFSDAAADHFSPILCDWLYCSDLELNSQYLQGLPVLAFVPLPILLPLPES